MQRLYKSLLTIMAAMIAISCCSCTGATEIEASISPMPTTKLEAEILSQDDALRLIIDKELDSVNTPLYFNSADHALYTGCVLSVSSLHQSDREKLPQVVSMVLCSLPVDPDADSYKFKLFEFIVDDSSTNSYRESIHEVFTVNKFDSSIKITS